MVLVWNPSNKVFGNTLHLLPYRESRHCAGAYALLLHNTVRPYLYVKPIKWRFSHISEYLVGVVRVYMYVCMYQ